MKTKNFTCFILGILFFTVSQVHSQNLISDGDFSSTTEINNYDGNLPPNEWCELLSSDAVANATVVDGVCYYQVTFSGYSTWEVQLAQGGFQLEVGHAYRLSFDVKADDFTSFGVFLGENEGNWTSLIGYDRYLQFANTDWQTIVLDFNTANGIFPYHKLSFELGTVTTNMYFDNVVLEDLGTYTPSIGILGSSVNGWDEDVNLETTDGVTYQLNNYPLTTGAVRFRQDDSWNYSWGWYDFPSGTAYLYGPNIQVPNPGNYDITFNLLTEEYSFTCVDNCHPFIGISGSAVTPNYEYGPDVNMKTLDGITYILTNHQFIDGEALFIQDDNPANSWGSNDFPTGTAVEGGPAIPVLAGNYNVTFNILTGDYTFELPNVGILGTALKGWETDIDMATTDGEIYTLTDYTFTDGEVKFRLDGSWEFNWGGWEFPNGWGYQDGPNIFVPAGTYNVTFNLLTGEYFFTATTCPIAGIQCPWEVFVHSEPGLCGSVVYYDDVTAATNCGGEEITIEQIEGSPSGSFFPVGYTLNTYLLTNEDGNTATCSFYVIVYESEPPVITISDSQIETLWPANHQMVKIPLDYTVSDNCDSDVQTEIYIFSNQPDNGSGDGNTGPDWEIVDNHNILLRAERSATDKNGREYYILIIAYDDSYNYALEQIIIRVPHDNRNTAMSPNNKTDENKSAINVGLTENNPFSTKIWPNPSNSNFNLEVKSLSNEPVLISVFDLNGRLISKYETINMNYFQFGEDLKSGMYPVTVHQGNNYKNMKIIKQ
jgi:hypothetical protein